MPSEKHSFSRRPLRNMECVHTKSLHLCLTLCNAMDCRWPGFSVHGILQARILEWVAIPSSRGIFLAQGSNSHLLSLLHWQVGILPPAPPGTLWPLSTVHGILQARILEWVAFPFSRGPSQARDSTQVSHIAGGFFTSWARREAQRLLGSA